MIIRSDIYGIHEIKEPVITELIKSKSVQRLKKISQSGVPNEYYFFKAKSRYNHSIGVFLLLKKLNANLEEQVAGLLHDVSHYAFSHVADWVFNTNIEENLQDSLHTNFFNKGELSHILKKHKFNPQCIAKLENFRLLDRDIPALCADRIDYCLQEFEQYSSKKLRDFCVKSLIVNNNEIIFDNKKAAQIFQSTFNKCQTNHWAGFQAITRYHILSAVLKKAIKNKIITQDDFLLDDQTVIKKIIKSKNPELNKNLTLLKRKIIRCKGFNWKDVKKKKRYVEPKYLSNHCVLKLNNY